MTDYIVGDIVWAKLTGYPWWPAKIEDENNLTKRVLAAKPKTSSPVWPVKFFATFDYGWFGQECLCPFEKGLSEYGNLNRRGNQFALAVEQAKEPQALEDSDEVPVSKKPAKRPTRPGSNSTSKTNKRSTSVAPKEKKAKTEKASNDHANSELSNSSNTSPIHQSDSKRTRPVLSRSSKDSAMDKPQKSEDEMEVEPQPKTETVVEATPKSSPARAETPVSPNSSSSRLAAKTKKPESSDDVPTMRTLRAALQKATVIEKFKNQETINGLLCTLEEGVFSPECLIATKMQKLMRHLYAHPIPKNDFKFKDRFRLLAIRFKSLETKIIGADNATKETDGSKQKPHKKDEPTDADKPGTSSSSNLDKEHTSAADTETKKEDSSQVDKEVSQSTDKYEKTDTSFQDKFEKPDTSSQEESEKIEPTSDTAVGEKDVDKEILSLVSDRQSDEEADQPKDTQEKHDLSTSVDKDSGADGTSVESKPSNPKESTELPNTNGNQNGVEGSDDSAAKHDDPPSHDHLEDKASSQISSNEQSSASNDSPRPEDKDDSMEDAPAKKSSLNINDSPIKPTTESVSDTLVNP